MIIQDESSSVEISLREMGASGTPGARDLGIDVAASASVTRTGGPFSGRNATVWIGPDSWNGFLRDLRELERTRRGNAQLLAMSPAEFQLIVRATDRAGHVAVEGWVGRQYAGRSAAAHDRVCFDIVIDPSTLARLIREFEVLAPGC
jgi:hypothetical protein